MTTITKTVQSLKCVIRTNRSCNLHSTVTAFQMYNVYRKNRSREMILKSIATNINGKLLLAAKIIRFFSFLNAESLKFLWSHLRAQKKKYNQTEDRVFTWCGLGHMPTCQKKGT